ncbi:MAG TPA: glycosyltransferase family 4 protein [Pyrinomonadaceae bacterium]|nr:glycosyltransferase family 4 protein [Pyrinomonadaceae bacterium]
MSQRKMRIAFATPEYATESYFDGGIAQYLQRITCALAALGHDVHVITLSEDKTDSFLRHGVTVHRVPPSHNWHRLNQATGYRLAATTYWLSLSGQIYRKLRELNAREPFDLIQFPNYSYCGLASMLFLRVPHVLRLSSSAYELNAGANHGWLDSLFLGVMEWLQVRLSKHVFAPSRALTELYAEEYHRPTIRVIRSPIYLETVNDFRIRDRLPAEYVLFFGRFQRHKGFEVLIKALSQVLEANPNINAVLIGRDVATPPMPSMRQYGYDLCGKFGAQFQMLEQLPHAQLYPIIAGAKLVVLPSLIDNLPNACLEAMALAAPVIGTVGTSMEELITDEETGFLVERGDVNALTEKILEVWAHPRRQEIGAAAKRRILDFSVEKATTELLDFYHQVLASNLGEYPASTLSTAATS